MRASVTEAENEGAVVPWMFGADTDVLSVKYRGEYCPFSSYKEPGRLLLNMLDRPSAGAKLPLHTAVLMDDHGVVLDGKFFEHEEEGEA